MYGVCYPTIHPLAGIRPLINCSAHFDCDYIIALSSTCRCIGGVSEVFRRCFGGVSVELQIRCILLFGACANVVFFKIK